MTRHASPIELIPAVGGSIRGPTAHPVGNLTSPRCQMCRAASRTQELGGADAPSLLLHRRPLLARIRFRRLLYTRGEQRVAARACINTSSLKKESRSTRMAWA